MMARVVTITLLSLLAFLTLRLSLLEMMDDVDKSLMPLHNMCFDYLQPPIFIADDKNTQDWWSYTWCYKHSITQMRVEYIYEVVDDTDSDENGNEKKKVKVSGRTTETMRIGLFSTKDSLSPIRQLYKENTKDITHQCIGGVEKNRRIERTTKVKIKCCSDINSSDNYQDHIHRQYFFRNFQSNLDNIVLDSDRSSMVRFSTFIQDVKEVHPCRYVINVCSEYLCGMNPNNFELDEIASGDEEEEQEQQEGMEVTIEVKEPIHPPGGSRGTKSRGD